MNRHGLNILIIVIWLIVTLCLMASCKGAERVIERTVVQFHTDTVIRSDSVLVTDSVYVRVGDTMVVERWHTEEAVRWREIARVDTICRRDSVLVVREPERSAWDKFRLRWFNALLVLVLALAAWTFRGPIAKIFRISAKTS